MNIKLNIKNAVIKQTGDTIEVISQGPKQIIDIELRETKAGSSQERRIYVHDKDDQAKIWMC